VGQRLGALWVFVGACAGAAGSSAPAAGPPGTWTCKQIIDECDSMCSTGMCIQACSRQGTPEAYAQHEALIACASANYCTENTCVAARCPSELGACQGVAAQPPPPPPPPQPPPQPEKPQPEKPQPEKPQPEKPQPEKPQPEKPAVKLELATTTGEWTFGSATAIGDDKTPTGVPLPGTGDGGRLQLAGDGRFERASSTQTKKGKCITSELDYSTGAWKIRGDTVVLYEKRAVHLSRDSCDKKKKVREDDIPAKEVLLRADASGHLVLGDETYRKK
jgi:hypothetical protein